MCAHTTDPASDTPLSKGSIVSLQELQDDFTLADAAHAGQDKHGLLTGRGSLVTTQHDRLDPLQNIGVAVVLLAGGPGKQPWLS
jgi:hypothetical protein